MICYMTLLWDCSDLITKKDHELWLLFCTQSNTVKPLVHPSHTYLDNAEDSQVPSYVLCSVHNISYASTSHRIV